jgi:hypothetical protein
MILKALNIVSIVTLVGAALYAYTIKYDSTAVAEQNVKLKAKIRDEKDLIAVMKAEWQLLNKPERLQALSAKTLDLTSMQLWQVGQFADLPKRVDKGDEIGRKLDLLGLGVPTATPSDDVTGSTPERKSALPRPAPVRETTTRTPEARR